MFDNSKIDAESWLIINSRLFTLWQRKNTSEESEVFDDPDSIEGIVDGKELMGETDNRLIEERQLEEEE